MTSEEIPVALERHEQMLRSAQHQINELKEVQREIKKMNEVLISLTGEIKHTNVSLLGHDDRLTELEKIPSKRMDSVIAAAISALVGGILGFILSNIFIL